MPVAEAQKLQGFTDEQITMIQRRIETYVKDEQYFEQFMNPVHWEKGHKTMQYRKAVKPKVRLEDIKPAVEGIAPRPIKVAVRTLEKSVEDYRDKWIYTREMTLWGYDELTRIGGDALADLVTQKLDLIKGVPFFKSPCVVTFDTSLLKTLAKMAIILGKNKAKYYKNGKYLAMLSPEGIEQIRTELEAKGSSISEGTKEDIDSGVIGSYGRWYFTECPSDLIKKSETQQYIVAIGRKPNGEMPIDCNKYHEFEVIHNALGTGVLIDEDGNVTADDNKQQGSIAVNTDGLSATINDELCVLNCTYNIDAINGFNLDADSLTGFVSQTPASKLIIKAYNSANGTEITSPTITVKKSDNSTSVTYSNGATVVAGDLYNVSVAKSGFTTANVKIIANAGENTYSVLLTASA